MADLGFDQLSPTSTTGSMASTQETTVRIEGAVNETITITSQLQSPLLRLPAELRNEVFSYALGGLIVYLNHDGTISYHTPERLERLDGLNDARIDVLQYTTNCLSLLTTCRQIYNESAHLPLEHYAYFYRTYSFESRLNTLPSTRIVAIKRIKITYHWFCPRGPCREYLEGYLDAIALLPFIENIEIMVVDHDTEDRARHTANRIRINHGEVKNWVHLHVVGYLDSLTGPPNSPDVVIRTEVVNYKCKTMEVDKTDVSGA
ncbi:hypothetical protein HBI56_125000 [Parastagonospora nodorum]|nr:hypothetical protein HBH51_128090 [Parastagonospora nodorum]KAH4056998.1 hypothetical protein HBH49_040220 [Parastagonospora nodorum]KAH4076806.1 hypothetical protein HBH50_010720 [Parastagonospora nodorum]KAH4095713.1 hypothetical protein HBH48_047060 [Parastagonospora nodorum]KAH4118768.1 hypothetical protein HBH47_137380 [Parastagonospora nodorum]